MKKRKLLVLAACAPLMLTGCSEQKKSEAINNINNNIINLVQNNDTISTGENLKYNFTGYEVWDNNQNQTLDVFCKLSDDTQKSYLKLSYDNVDFANYNFEDEINTYNSIASIVNDYNEYTIQNIEVYDFNNFDKVFGLAIPQKDSNGHDINAYEVLSIDNLNYNDKTNQLEFNSNVVADYKWNTITTTLVWTGKVAVPITNTYIHHNYENYSYDVKYNMLEEDYNKYKNDTKELINLLENYVEMGLTSEYSISESEKTLNTTLRSAKQIEATDAELSK